MVAQRNSLHPRKRLKARKKAAQPNSLLLKHYTLFNSLARYALDDPSTSSSSSIRTLSATTQAARERARRLDRLKQRYPVAGISSYTWPRAFPQLPPQSQTPSELLDELVERVVKETFDTDYARFRSPAWAKEHRITQEHLDRIVVDPHEVAESAAAAKALVHTMLGRFLTRVKKGVIGKENSSVSASAASPSSSTRIPRAELESPAEGAASTEPGPADDDVAVDEGLDEEIWQDEKYPLDWQSLLDYFQSTAGSSKTAQWRNWHLLNAIAKTRQRCEELFGHEPR